MDDVTILQAGHQICADSVVVEGSIEVNESLITGEPDAIVKTRATALCREVTSYRDAQKQKSCTSAWITLQ